MFDMGWWFNKSKESKKTPKKTYGKKLIPFDYKQWLVNRELKVVDEDGYSVEVCSWANDDSKHVVVINGRVHEADTIGLPIFFEVDDPEEKPFKEYEVSRNAVEFESKLRLDSKKTVIETMTWFISLCGIFGHHAFFTDELWRNVEGFENEDKAEIINAFICWWVRYEFGYLFYSVGCSWATNYPERYDAADTEMFDSHIGKYWPVIKAYYEWCENQR